MKTVAGILFILCHFSNLTNGVPSTGGIVKPGYYEIPGTNGLYKYHDTASVWDDAAATCAAEGASLFYAENENEFNTVIRYWQTVRNDFPGLFFVGIKRSEGVFKTINDTPIANVYHGWLSGEPRNKGRKENCVEAKNYRHAWGLEVKTCDVRRTFICKLSNNNGQCSSTPCTYATTEGNVRTSPGYFEIQGTSGLYKYHDTLSVWDDAAATCAAEGARLYYAENENEFYTVITYLQTVRNDFPERFFVGIKKSKGVFKTINGVPITNVYHGWLSGEPRNKGRKESCVEAKNYRHAWGLKVKTCDVRRTFICKLLNNNGQCSGTACIHGRIVKAGYHVIPGTNGLYKFHNSYSVWDDAAATCVTEGARLFYADKDKEFHLVLKFWKTRRSDFPNEFFVGIKKSQGVFKTINGIPIANVYNGWSPGEPNNKGNENCVMAWHFLGVWGLNDKSCNVFKTFICKAPNNDVRCSDNFCIDKATKGNFVTPSGYYQIPGTNGLYKYHDIARVWDDAAATCADEGARLYYAENNNEFRTVNTYWQTMRNDFPKEYFVGIRKTGSVFKTINGIPIFKVYNVWMPGEPNSRGQEHCVEARNYPHASGLNDKSCDVLKPFICKLPNVRAGH